MSKRIKQIIHLTLCLVFLTECQNSMIPRAHLPEPAKVEKSITGSWIVMTIQQNLPLAKESDISGELIAIENDTVYLLTATALVKIHHNTIITAVLYPFRPQNATAPIIAGLSLLPNVFGAFLNHDAGAYVLIIGIPLAVTGTLMGILEYYGNIMRYPQKYNLTDFGKYARFPQGLPPGLDPGKLRLK